MAVIPAEYYTKEKIVKLTQSEMDLIIDELERTEQNVYAYLNYKQIINKLRGKDEQLRKEIGGVKE